MKQREQFDQQLIEKAMKDQDFRQRLLENPKTVIAEETGVKIPEGLNVKVLQEDQSSVYLVLPFIYPESKETELCESELEMVSGGNKWSFEGCGPGDGSTY